MTNEYELSARQELAWPKGEVGAGGLTADAPLVDIERLWHRALNLRYWLVGALAICVLLGVAATLLQTPQFRSTSRIEISRVDSGGADVKGISIKGEARDRQYYETQYELLQSRFLAERVVKAENLIQNPEFREIFNLSGEGPRVADVAATRLQSLVMIDPIDDSNLVDISVSSPSAALSARIANSWAKQFLDANYEKRFGDTIQARNQLENQLEELRAKLEMSEASLISYANANEIVVIQSTSTDGGKEPTQQTLVAAQLSALSSALSDATARRIAAESAVRAGAGSASGVTDGQPALRARLAEAQAQLANQGASLGRQNPKVIALEAEIASLQGSLGKESSTASSSRQAEYRKARLEEEQLRQRFEAAKAQYLSQQKGGVQYGILKREVDTNRELYDALLQRYKELGVAGTGNNNMALIEQARVPTSPYEPSLLKNLLIALAAGILLCLLVVYLADLMDQSVSDPSEVRRQLGLPVLGLIPLVDEGEIEAQLADPYSVLSESYSSTRVSLFFAMAEGADGAIMITSTQPEEGKTLSSLALAHNLSKLGKKVLLIDLDLRRTGLSKMLSVRQVNDGMVAFLSGSVESPMIIPVEKFGFDFIPSGGRPDNPAQLLAGPRAKGLIDRLKSQYDHVIVDGPPVLGLADAPELGQAVDGVVYVIQANAATFRSIRNGLGRLKSAHIRLLGSIITQLDQRNDHYGYGFGYGYGYSYGDVGSSKR